MHIFLWEMMLLNEKKSKLRIIISSTICLLSIVLNIALFIYTGLEKPVLKPQNNVTPQINFYNGSNVNIFGDSITSSTSAPTTDVTDKTPSTAIPTVSEGKVVGKVIDKFVSPYTANTSYKNIYLKNSTDLKVNIKTLLEEPLKYKIEGNTAKPEILILHTHATESFLTSTRDYYTDKDLTRSNDNNLNMIALGEIVTAKLKNAGFGVIHDKTLHDYPSYNESYSRAAKTINSYLKNYPSIKIVIDMHRDALASGDTDKVKLTTDIGGKKTAQIMLVMGSQSGGVKNFPNWKENLKLAVRLQSKLETMYPSLARSISLTSKNYNESLTQGSMLVEMGTDGNSLEEVKYSAELLSNALISLLSEI